MSDSRLEVFSRPDGVGYAAGSIRITGIRIEGYRFFSAPIELAIAGKNLLVYGENGTGKSSIYRALGLLAGKGLGSIADTGNIFSPDTLPEIEFSFSTGQTLILDSDSTEIPLGFEFLKPLAIFVPLLDYKRLLRIHFSSEGEADRINIYATLRELFHEYPTEKKGKLSEIRNAQEYFDALGELINNELLLEINDLISVFDRDFSIDRFEISTELDEAGRAEPIVSIAVDYRDTPIKRYHVFLNEARLSALAIALYFASIRRILTKSGAVSCKILVLDDLLISLDMSNRLKLLEILKTRFSDFQVFFFTHDKDLFEIYSDNMDWKGYELYMDDSGEVPGAIIKDGKSDLDKAKVFFASTEYEACALFLRKGLECLMRGYLISSEKYDKNHIDLSLAKKVENAIQKSQGEKKDTLLQLAFDLKHILNPQCHYDDKNIFSQELKAAINHLGLLTELLKH